MIWDEERSAGDIASQLPVTFGTVSQHLGLLRDECLAGTREFWWQFGGSPRPEGNPGQLG
jgi:hypothetical protein